MKEVVLGALAGSFAICASAGNLVTNGGFEAADPKAGWSMPGSPWKLVDGDGYAASRAVVWETRDAKFPHVYPSWPVDWEPGAVYRFSVRVKIDEAKGFKKPAVSVDWCDNRGKYLSQDYAEPVVDNDPHADGWVRYVGKTAPMPVNVGKGRFLCYLRQGTTGRVRFDDFELEKLGVEWADYLISSTYRNTAWTGTVSFASVLHVNAVKHPLDTLVAEFSVRRADGTRVWVPADGFTADLARLNRPVETLAMGAHEVVFRIRPKAGGVAFTEKRLVFTRRETPLVDKAWIDPRKRLIADGRPFFPIGMYNWDASETTMSLYTNMGFNCMLTSCSAAWAERLAKFNLKYIAGASGADAGKARRNIATVADRPHLLAWYTADEAPPNLLPEKLERYRTIRELDRGGHPVFGVFDKSYHVRGYLEALDIVGMDPYPIGNAHLGGLEMPTTWSRQCLEESFGFRAMWQVPQAFSWASDRKPNPALYGELRFPTAEEFRNLSYQAIASGANGLVWFRFESVAREPQVRQYVKETVREIARYAPVFLYDGADASVAVSGPAVTARAWRNGGETWVLLVNTKRTKTDFTVKTSGGAVMIEAALCDGKASPAGGRVEVSLRPMGVTLLRLGELTR